jgi:transcription initiation factor TFIIIB Brf1 subunit/transcription initiation factor TFIIB
MPTDAAKKARALSLILDAWEQALSEGAEPDLVASVAIYAALADMVERYGPQAVAEFCAHCPSACAKASSR